MTDLPWWPSDPGGGVAATIVDAKGDLIVASANDIVTRKAVGVDGRILQADSAQSDGLGYSTRHFDANSSKIQNLAPPDGASDAATRGWTLSNTVVPTIADAKGDLIVATANDTVTRKAVGSDGLVLKADSADATGVSWGTVSSTGLANGAVTDAKIDATGITTRSKLPSPVAYEDEANTFTQNQNLSGTSQLGVGRSGAVAGPAAIVHRAGEVGSFGNNGTATGPLTITNYTGASVGYLDSRDAFLHVYRATGIPVGKGTGDAATIKSVVWTQLGVRGAGRDGGGGWATIDATLNDHGAGWPVQQVNITNITNTANATVTCAGHDFIVGEQVAIYGVTPTAWNQVFKVLAKDTGAGTIQIDNAAGLGAYTSGGVVRNAPSGTVFIGSVAPRVNRTYSSGSYPAHVDGSTYPSLNSDDLGVFGARNSGIARATGAFGVFKSNTVTLANSDFITAFACEADVDYLVQATQITVGGDNYFGEAGACVDFSKVTLVAGGHYMRMGYGHAITARPLAGGTNVFRHLLSLGASGGTDDLVLIANDGNAVRIGGAVTPAGGINQYNSTNTRTVWANDFPNVMTTGTDTTPVAGTIYFTEVWIGSNCTLTGIGYAVGTVGGTDSVIVALYDATGTLVANSALAGTTVGTAALMQRVPFTATYAAKGPGLYYMAVQFNGTTARFRTWPGITNTRPWNHGSQAGTFGTLPAITPPTTSTENVGPVSHTY